MPRTRDVLDLTLPYIDDNELETLIDQRTQMLVRQLEAEKSASTSGGAGGGHGGGGGNSGSRGGRGQISVQFFEKRRRKTWYMRGEEEVCWESWTVKVTVAEPRTESGKPCTPPYYDCSPLTPQNEQRSARQWSQRSWPPS